MTLVLLSVPAMLRALGYDPALCDLAGQFVKGLVPCIWLEAIGRWARPAPSRMHVQLSHGSHVPLRLSNAGAAAPCRLAHHSDFNRWLLHVAHAVLAITLGSTAVAVKCKGCPTF